jgi:hypothetical protein
VGLAPVSTQVGDIVFRVEGLDTVDIVRERGDEIGMIDYKLKKIS